MNFFVVDLDPRQAARDLCDKHVSKMHTEGVQCFVQILHDLEIPSKILTKAGNPHKGCHAHPCVEWLKASRENLIWAVDHVDELCWEHGRRFKTKGKPNVPYSRHQLDVFICQHYHVLVDHTLPNVPRTPFAQAMPDEYRDSNPVEAYRNYYIGEKVDFAEWNHCDPPQWWVEAFNYSNV